MCAADPTWRRLARGELSWETYRERALILSRIRAFFGVRGFLDVDPPIAVACPNIDPNVFPVRLEDAAGAGSDLFLHTSPELSMKKLLAAGSGNIFYLGKVFRNREGSPLHSPEFTMLEWYREGADAAAVMRDVEELCRTLSREVRGREDIERDGRAVSLAGAWQRWDLSDACAELLGAAPADAGALRAALSRRGLRPGAREEWEDLFFRAYVDVIEPALRSRGAVFLTGFPAALAAMARRRDGDAGVCERFEGYLAGIELVNGYEELTDPREQEVRLAETAVRLRRECGHGIGVDGDFLDALRRGLPPCAGAALGVDRLIMLLLGKDSIADVSYR